MTAVAPRRGGAVVAAIGGGLVVPAVTLYLTELSRAVGVVVAGVAAVALGGGLTARWRRKWPPRGLLIAFAAVLAGLVVLGVWTWLLGLSSPPRSV